MDLTPLLIQLAELLRELRESRSDRPRLIYGVTWSSDELSVISDGSNLAGIMLFTGFVAIHWWINPEDYL